MCIVFKIKLNSRDKIDHESFRSVQFSGIWFIHKLVQPSPPSSSRTFRHPSKKPHPTQQSVPPAPPHGSLWICLVWTVHVNGIPRERLPRSPPSASHCRLPSGTAATWEGRSWHRLSSLSTLGSRRSRPGAPLAALPPLSLVSWISELLSVDSTVWASTLSLKA